MLSFIQPSYNLNIKKGQSVPNLILAGPPGCGKTSLSYFLFKNIREYNASDNRGIGFIREKLKSFLKLERKTIQTILLDEADYLTRDAQAALRRLMEDYQDKVRFILTCNDATRIIKPIQSRCFRFQLKSDLNEFDTSIFDKMQNKNADMQSYYAENKFLFFLCKGDKRLFINTLYGNYITKNTTDIDYINNFFCIKNKNDALIYLKYFYEGGFNFSLFKYILIFYVGSKLNIFEKNNELSGIFYNYKFDVIIDLKEEKILRFLSFLGSECDLEEICFYYLKLNK